MVHLSILLLAANTEVNYCESKEVYEKLPLYVSHIDWDSDQHMVNLNFRPFSMGYEGGFHPKEAKVSLLVSERYKFKDSNETSGTNRSLFTEFVFLAECTDSVIIQFNVEVNDGHEKNSSSDLYKVKKPK